MSGVADVKEVIKIAKNEQSLFKRKTILFIDEIHRFNKMQQVNHIQPILICIFLIKYYVYTSVFLKNIKYIPGYISSPC